MTSSTHWGLTKLPSFCRHHFQIHSFRQESFVFWLKFHRNWFLRVQVTTGQSQITRFMGPTWGPPRSCRPQVGPILAPWTLLSGYWFKKKLYAKQVINHNQNWQWPSSLTHICITLTWSVNMSKWPNHILLTWWTLSHHGPLLQGLAQPALNLGPAWVTTST